MGASLSLVSTLDEWLHRAIRLASTLYALSSLKPWVDFPSLAKNSWLTRSRTHKLGADVVRSSRHPSVRDMVARDGQQGDTLYWQMIRRFLKQSVVIDDLHSLYASPDC